jgi:glycosyltransferase involved in cell wall biosynthesis
VLVAPSMLHEPFGLPLAEALASGLPIIASRAGGMAGIVEDGVTGRLVERGDAVALASAIRTMLMDATGLLAMRGAARTAAETRFGWEQAADRLEAAYARVTRSERVTITDSSTGVLRRLAH